MERLSHYGIVVARVLASLVFVLNGFGVIDQTIPAKELIERGAPVSLVPATFVSHSFWLAAGTPAFQGQLINFCKNAAIWGALLFIASSEPATNKS